MLASIEWLSLPIASRNAIETQRSYFCISICLKKWADFCTRECVKKTTIYVRICLTASLYVTSICPLEVHKNLQPHWAHHDLGNVHSQNEKLHVMVLPHWKTNMSQNLLGVISACDMTFQLLKWHVSWLCPCFFYHLEDYNVCIIPVSDITLLSNCYFSVIYATINTR